MCNTGKDRSTSVRKCKDRITLTTEHLEDTQRGMTVPHSADINNSGATSLGTTKNK